MESDLLAGNSSRKLYSYAPTENPLTTLQAIVLIECLDVILSHTLGRDIVQCSWTIVNTLE